MNNNNSDKEEQLTLQLLEAIGENSDVSQRHLARKMGVALGLANSYLKRCIRKGYVKISEAPANRYLYYLTPQGFSEKSRLTARYLSISFSFYRKAGDSCRRAFASCNRNGWHRIVLCGVSDLAEIASIRALEMNIEIVAVYDPDSGREYFVSKPVAVTLGALPAHDAYLLTDLEAPHDSYRELAARIDPGLLVVPDVLRLDTELQHHA